MDPQEAYDQLIDHSRNTALLASCASVLGWDERTYMPTGGSAHRANQMSLLSGMVHERITRPEVGEMLDLLDGSAMVEEPLSEQSVNFREIRRGYERAVKLPRSLVEEIAHVTTVAQQIWTEARKRSDFNHFEPHLDRILELKRLEAACLGTGATLYDALLDDYEPGETTENLTRVFSALREDLVELVGAIQGSECQRDGSILRRDFPEDGQARFGRAVAEQIGFDFGSGRLDVTTHPFCSGIGPGDTRITTRFDERLFSQAFFGILHEAGHGIYDQGLPTQHFGTPMGNSVSLGIHESQSRMWENFVGRSRAFWTHFLPKAQSVFPSALGDASLDAFYFAVNQVSPSHIRVEADEATYNLHILLRFEIEQAMINDGLRACDVPGAWNETFREHLGLEVPNDASGCLQDIHWSGGGIGYFPTYTLGNLYAAQFFDRAREDLGDLEASIARGEFGPLKAWLSEKIFRHGQRYLASQLAMEVTGRPLSHEPLITHLCEKFGELYAL